MNNNELHKILKIIICVTIGFALLTIMLVHVLYKTKAPFNFFISEWSAGDMLTFLGSIGASMATIVGVFLSVRFSVFNYEEDERRRIQPYISIKTLYARSKFSFDTIYKEEEKDGYEEYYPQKWYCIIENTRLRFETKLTTQELYVLQHAGFSMEELATGVKGLVCNKIVNLPCVLENVGNGVGLSLRVNVTSEKGISTGWLHLEDIKVGERTQINLICLELTDTMCGRYKIVIDYFDIYDNAYCQTCFFIVEDNNGRIEYGINKEEYIQPKITKHVS